MVDSWRYDGWQLSYFVCPPGGWTDKLRQRTAHSKWRKADRFFFKQHTNPVNQINHTTHTQKEDKSSSLTVKFALCHVTWVCRWWLQFAPSSAQHCELCGTASPWTLPPWQERSPQRRPCRSSGTPAAENPGRTASCKFLKIQETAVSWLGWGSSVGRPNSPAQYCFLFCFVFYSLTCLWMNIYECRTIIFCIIVCGCVCVHYLSHVHNTYQI